MALTGSTILSNRRNDIEVCTTASPFGFKTEILGGPHDHYSERGNVWEDPTAMHKRACAIAWPDDVNELFHRQLEVD